MSEVHDGPAGNGDAARGGGNCSVVDFPASSRSGHGMKFFGL